MERDPDAAVQSGEHLHQPVQREPPEIRVADAREIRRGEAGHARGLAHRECVLIQHRDDPGREDRLGLFQIRMRVIEVPKDIPASLNQCEVALVYYNSSLFNISAVLATVSRSLNRVPAVLPGWLQDGTIGVRTAPAMKNPHHGISPPCEPVGTCAPARPHSLAVWRESARREACTTSPQGVNCT